MTHTRARIALLAAIVPAGLVLGACGGDSDEDKAISTAEDFFGALAEVDAEKACELNLGSDGQPLSDEHDDWQGCLDGVDNWANATLMPDDGEFPDVSFDTVEISGDTGHLPDAAPDEFSFQYDVDLKKVDGDWYLDGGWYL